MERSVTDRFRSLVWKSMNRPGLRTPLGLLGSAFCSWRTGRSCQVRYDGVWIHRFSDGTVADLRIRQNTPTPDRFRRLTQDIFFYGHQPGPGETVLDLGAGIGAESFALAPLVGSSGRIHAVEAHPRTFECLQTMVRLNRLGNVSVDALAIADFIGEVSFEDDGDAHISNAVSATGSGIVVPATTLDEYCRQRNIESVDFLKMNIEGAEVRALEGGPQTLAQTRNIVVSCHDFKADRTGNEFYRTKATVRELLHDAGFTLLERTHDPRPWVRDTIYGQRASGERS
ncbi:MAG: FkbM family methyltransferase [Myxococcota bacterium]